MRSMQASMRVPNRRSHWLAVVWLAAVAGAAGCNPIQFGWSSSEDNSSGYTPPQTTAESVPCDAACFTGKLRDTVCIGQQEMADGTPCGDGRTCLYGECPVCSNQPDGAACGTNARCVGQACVLDPAMSRWTLYSTAPRWCDGCTSPDTLMMVNPASGRQTPLAAAGKTPPQLALARDPQSGALYGITNGDYPGFVTRIDPSSGDPVLVANLGSHLTGIAISPAGQGYVITSSRNLARVDLSTWTVSWVGILGTDASALDFSGDGTLYVVFVDTSTERRTLGTVDPATAKTLTTVPLSHPYAVADLAWHPDGFLYFANDGNALMRIDPRTGQETIVGFGSLGALRGVAAGPMP